jgi:hypothetical protein
MKTTLTIFNDGCESFDSFEAYIDNLTIGRGYGENQEVAINNYVIILHEYIAAIVQMSSDLNTGNFEAVSVGCKGE